MPDLPVTYRQGKLLVIGIQGSYTAGSGRNSASSSLIFGNDELTVSIENNGPESRYSPVST
jgi:hypothetical protein